MNNEFLLKDKHIKYENRIKNITSGNMSEGIMQKTAPYYNNEKNINYNIIIIDFTIVLRLQEKKEISP